jgi:hypothetical protein
MYFHVDCDGDGVLDHACKNGGKQGVLASAWGCGTNATNQWPNAPNSACYPAFGGAPANVNACIHWPCFNQGVCHDLPNGPDTDKGRFCVCNPQCGGTPAKSCKAPIHITPGNISVGFGLGDLLGDILGCLLPLNVHLGANVGGSCPTPKGHCSITLLGNLLAHVPLVDGLCSCVFPISLITDLVGGLLFTVEELLGSVLECAFIPAHGPIGNNFLGKVIPLPLTVIPGITGLLGGV